MIASSWRPLAPASSLPMLQRLQLGTATRAEERRLQRSTLLALRLAGLT